MKNDYIFKIMALRRRQGWIIDNINLRKFQNLFAAIMCYLFKSKKVSAVPAIVKIDITPLCNLSCTVCVHAKDSLNRLLSNQYFSNKMNMNLNDYREIINEIKGKSLAVSLYYLGDPFVNPNINDMTQIARDADLNVHLSTNFSFDFSDDQLTNIIKSGVTHLTICIDGLTQANYTKTRVGGKIKYVINNLTRLCEFRNNFKSIYPKIEVQYIKYQHNVHEIDAAKELFSTLGINHIAEYWGSLHNYVDLGLENLRINGLKNRRTLPCFWPYFSMVIKYNGDVIPCCNHRLDEQYNKLISSPILGNAFKTGVMDVWNQENYQKLRDYIVNPNKFVGDELFNKYFCYGCGMIFDTNRNDLLKIADNYKYEDIFDDNGHRFP